MGHKQIKAQWLVVTDHKDANGNVREVLTVIDGPELPWRLLKRRTKAHALGLDYVRSLPKRKPWDEEGVRAVSVCDGTRVLASWTHMTGIGGYTGTHAAHTLVRQQLR